MNRILACASVSVVLFCLTSCAAILKADPGASTDNPNVYKHCPLSDGGTIPCLLADTCPGPGQKECHPNFAGAPWPDGKSVQPDAGVTPAVKPTAKGSEVHGVPALYPVREDGKG